MPTYVCAQCGRNSAPDEFTAIDARYTTGKCPMHKGSQYLVREDVVHTEKQRKLRQKEKDVRQG